MKSLSAIVLCLAETRTVSPQNTTQSNSFMLRGQLARASFWSLVARCCAYILGVALTITLARVLGASEFGLYSYVITIVSLLSIPVQFGLPSLLVRETARCLAGHQWDKLRALWRWTTTMAVSLSAAIALASGTTAYMVRSHYTRNELVVFVLGLLLVPMIALGNLRGAALRGLNFGVLGQLPENIIRPSLLILFTLLISVLQPFRTVGAPLAMLLHVAAGGIAFLCGALMLITLRPRPLTECKSLTYERTKWLQATLPLGLVASMHFFTLHVDILVLGVFRSAEDVGIYRVVSQGGVLVAFGLQAINLVVAAQFARLHSLGDMRQLQKLVTASTRASLLLATPVALVFVLFGDVILREVFGPAYAAGFLPLAIIAVGQVANAAIGLVGSLLNMTGFERATARGLVLAAILNLVLNMLLVPPFGMTGAASATAATLALWKLTLWRLARSQLSINTLPIAIRYGRDAE